MPARPSVVLPVVSCLIAATLWGTFWYPLRELEGQGLPGVWATLTIYIGAMLALLPWLWLRRRKMVDQLKAQPLNLLAIAAASGWCNLAFILAVIDGTVVRVLLLFYLSPMWTVLLGWLILRERPDRAAGLTLLLAMVGGAIMLWPQRDATLTATFSLPDLLALSAGLAFALNNVMVRRTGYIPIGFKMTAAWIGVLTLTVLAIVITSASLPSATVAGWGGAFAFGLVVMLLMTYTAQYGVTHLPVYRSAIIFLFEIVAGAVSAWLLSDEFIHGREWLGGGLVIIAAWQSARAERERKDMPDVQARA